MKKILKKNQVIIYAIALMLITAGYLNFTTQTTEVLAETEVANIGDATLVSSNEVEFVDNSETESDLSDLSENEDNYAGTSEDDINESEDTSGEVIEDEYFTQSKLDRDTMYSQMLESYENILNSSNSTENQKQVATEEIQLINDLKNSIMICENLLNTKGFTNNVIFVNGDSVSVVIGVDELEKNEVAQIQNIISRELDAEIEDIHISTKNSD